MNKSIFQKWQLIAILIFILIISVNSHIITNCSNLKFPQEMSVFALKEISHNNINFKVSSIISEYNSKLALDMLLNNHQKNSNCNFKISKYLFNKNGSLIYFNKESCFSHPNVCFGVFNNLYFNFQLSHNKVNDYFSLLCKKDVRSLDRGQFICSQLYLYPIELAQINLNYNDIDSNNIYSELNNEIILNEIKHNIQAEDFINTNKNRFNLYIKNTLTHQ